MNLVLILVASGALVVVSSAAAGEPVTRSSTLPSAFQTGVFRWKASAPLVRPTMRPDDPCVSIKDPTVVHFQGRWHVICTIRRQVEPVSMVYLSFEDWSKANDAPRIDLNLHDQYNCAPQVFWFAPHHKWYLFHQRSEKDHKPPFGPACSTTDNIADPRSWSKPTWMFPNPPEGQKWLDFWVICDDVNAYLFFTSLDGKMWRSATKLADFPTGWSPPVVALQGDIFEASHTYKLKGHNLYLTIIEAQGNNRRYYKAYLADRLDGAWRPLADTLKKPFASVDNVVQDGLWTASVSHGELLRCGIDQTMEVDPASLRFLIQGATDPEYRSSGGYGKIPWKLGLLELTADPTAPQKR